MNDELLSDLIVAVEQQLASSQTKYVGKTYERLCGNGMAPEQAKEQIALCLGGQMNEMMRLRCGFDEQAYREALDSLPMREG